MPRNGSLFMCTVHTSIQRELTFAGIASWILSSSKKNEVTYNDVHKPEAAVAHAQSGRGLSVVVRMNTATIKSIDLFGVQDIKGVA